MGVYIDMEMPKNCYNCWLGHKCPKYEALLWNEIDKERKPDCPLVPVPPHGRLIDADEFYESLTMDDRVTICEAMHVQSILSDAPNIIPAESITAEEEKNDK